MQVYDNEKGKGTMSPIPSCELLVRALNAAYVEPSRRPADGRYGENPNRRASTTNLCGYEAISSNIQELTCSLFGVGINPLEHDIRFVEDNRENPSTAWLVWAGKCGWMAWKSPVYLLPAGRRSATTGDS